PAASWSWQRWSGSIGTTTLAFTARSATFLRPNMRPSGTPGRVDLWSPDPSRDDCTQPGGTHTASFRPTEWSMSELGARHFEPWAAWPTKDVDWCGSGPGSS